MKIYISGAISNDPGYREKFKVAEERIRERGDTPINPAALSEAIPGLDYEDYMWINFQLIEIADEVHFLPGWYTSAGAVRECYYCNAIEKPRKEEF